MVEKFEYINAKSSSVTTEEVIADLKRVAELASSVKLTRKKYDEFGTYNSRKKYGGQVFTYSRCSHNENIIYVVKKDPE